MKLIFVGRGGGFAGLNPGNTNMILESDRGKRLLIDCGLTCPLILRDEMNIPWDSGSIDSIYISHLHDDHLAGLGYMALFNYFAKIMHGGAKHKLYCAAPLVTKIWQSIRGHLDTIQGKIVNMETYFDVHAIPDNDSFLWEAWQFELIQTLHVAGGNVFMNSYGLKMKNILEKVPRVTFITTDTQFSHPSPLQAHYDSADIIFHDGEYPFKTHVHPWIPDMAEQLDEETKAKIHISHWTERPEGWKDMGFAGFVEKGDAFEL